MSNVLVAVTDAFEIKPNRPGSDHAPGLVVIFDGRQCAFRLPPMGSRVMLLRPDGTVASAQITEGKEHGYGRSFFFDGLHDADAPVGTIIIWAAADVGTDGEASFALHDPLAVAS